MPAYYIHEKYLYVRGIYADVNAFKKAILTTIHKNYWRLDNQAYVKGEIEMFSSDLGEQLLEKLSNKKININGNGNYYRHSGSAGYEKLQKFINKLQEMTSLENIINLLASVYVTLSKNLFSTGFYGGSKFRDVLRSILDETLCLVDNFSKEIQMKDVKIKYKEISRENFSYSLLLNPCSNWPKMPIAYTLANAGYCYLSAQDKNNLCQALLDWTNAQHELYASTVIII